MGSFKRLVVEGVPVQTDFAEERSDTVWPLRPFAVLRIRLPHNGRI